MAGLLEPYVGGLELAAGDAEKLYDKLGSYLELLVRWNAKTNLTAVRDAREMVRRHFGESLFAGLCLRRYVTPSASLLDVGSGAGFPGLPMQLLSPGWRVTLAESQGKKAAFLREAVRELGLEAEVWAGRVEEMPATRRFGAVALRAVDRMPQMVEVARQRVARPGVLLEMSGVAGGDAALEIPERRGSYVNVTVVR
ncbi:MAG: 16S rRNA (guanine(527)-N(7))-methyltransferase RsmG [Rhodospirillales bacterium]|nr:16S rRNA (guanine(527)-N(7))-methyltransferase RsmG [Acetobacter sp.]